MDRGEELDFHASEGGPGWQHVQHHWWYRLSRHHQRLLALLEALERLVQVMFYFGPYRGLIFRDVHQDGNGSCSWPALLLLEEP